MLIFSYLYDTLEQDTTIGELEGMLITIMQEKEQTDLIMDFIKTNAIEKKNIEIEKTKKILQIENR